MDSLEEYVERKQEPPRPETRTDRIALNIVAFFGICGVIGYFLLVFNVARIFGR